LIVNDIETTGIDSFGGLTASASDLLGFFVGSTFFFFSISNSCGSWKVSTYLQLFIRDVDFDFISSPWFCLDLIAFLAISYASYFLSKSLAITARVFLSLVNNSSISSNTIGNSSISPEMSFSMNKKLLKYTTLALCRIIIYLHIIFENFESSGIAFESKNLKINLLFGQFK